EENSYGVGVETKYRANSPRPLSTDSQTDGQLVRQTVRRRSCHYLCRWLEALVMIHKSTVICVCDQTVQGDPGLSEIEHRQDSPLVLQSDRNVTVNARNDQGQLTGQLIVGSASALVRLVDIAMLQSNATRSSGCHSLHNYSSYE
ncbi:unnamed protein product, partial [Pleuronectes platessa]